jgi:signal transduction histidine kinase/ligand-binding sensor domain-containing protein
MRKVLLLTIAGFFFVLQAWGQPVVFHHFTHYSTKEGIGSPNVRKTFQDSKGLIWCATQDGLYRFNGKRFTGYNKMNTPGYRLSASVVIDMLEYDGLLWVASAFGGVDAIDIVDGRIKYQFNGQQYPEFKEAVFWSLARTGDTLFIGGTRGLYMLDMQKKQLLPHPLFAPGSETPLLITKVKSDSATQTLWVFARGTGVYALNSKTLAIRAFFPEANNYVLDCDLAADHSVWAGTSGGIRKYVLSGQSIHADPRPLPLIPASQGSFIYALKIVGNDIYFSNKNNLAKADLGGKRYSYIRESTYGNNSDWTGAVFGIMVDNNGFLWLSCMQGLSFSNNRQAAFFSYSHSTDSQDKIGHARTVFPYNDSLVYVCAEDGLYKVNTLRGTIRTIDKTRAYFFCFKDHNGRLIVSNDENSFVLQEDQLIPLKYIYPEFSKADSVVINSITTLPDSSYMLGTENKRGVFIWDIPLRKLNNITDKTSGLKLEENIVNAVFTDRSGLVWILADNAIMLFDKKRNSMNRLVLQHPRESKNYRIFFDIRDLNNRFYISSYGHGIIVLNSKREFVEEITTANGLANNGVYKILSVSDSILLVTTNNGLSAVNLRSGRIKNYYASDGLHSNEFEEFSGAGRHNIFFAGGAEGFTMMYPEKFVANASPPVLYWSSVNIETGAGIKDTANLDFTVVRVPNDAVQTTISFSALNYNNPSRTTFSYRIKELQKDWINIQYRDFINLIGLAPGTYTLEVKAFNEDGVESTKPIEMKLRFLPKWYQTVWFQLLIAIMTAGLLYAFFRYRLNQIRARQKIRKDIASDLHDDIGATLNSVKVFMHLIKRDPGKEENIEQAEDSLTQATTGLRDMIWVLDDSEDTLQELADRIRKFAVPVTGARQILFELTISPDIYSHAISKTEKRNLLLIAKESINNSIKYSDCRKIVLEIQLTAGKVYMSVTDDGQGFDMERIHRGNGLDNIYYRSKQIGYVADIRSAPGNGTAVILEKK